MIRVRQRPVDVYQIQTVLSVDEVAIKSDFFDHDIQQIGDQSAQIIFAIPRVKKSHITRRPSEQPTANIEPLINKNQKRFLKLFEKYSPTLLKAQQTAIDAQSSVPSNSSG